MSTIIVVNSTDIIANSRADLNTNFANLNTDKQEKGTGVTGNLPTFGASNVLGDSGITPASLVPKTTTVNGKALSANVTLGLASADFANQGTAITVLHGNAAGNPTFSAVVEGDQSLSDITTNNASSTKHGYSPKSPADATQFLNGAATPAFALVKDSDLSTTDITTNNATAAKHGFLPKLSGSAADVLKGDGTFGVPTGSGQPAWALVGTITYAGATGVQSLTGLTAADMWMIVFDIVVSNSTVSEYFGLTVNNLSTGYTSIGIINPGSISSFSRTSSIMLAMEASGNFMDTGKTHLTGILNITGRKAPVSTYRKPYSASIGLSDKLKTLIAGFLDGDNADITRFDFNTENSANNAVTGKFKVYSLTL